MTTATAEVRSPLAWARVLLYRRSLQRTGRHQYPRASTFAVHSADSAGGAAVSDAVVSHSNRTKAVAQIPKEILRNNSWVVPTLQGEPYLDKPPADVLADCAQLFRVRSFTRIGTTGAGVVRPSHDSGDLLHWQTKHWRTRAFWAAVLLAVAPGFVSIARLILLDGLLTLCVTVSVLCGFEAVRTGTFKRSWWIAAAIASGLGFLTKGPISGSATVCAAVGIRVLGKK